LFYLETTIKLVNITNEAEDHLNNKRLYNSHTDRHIVKLDLLEFFSKRKEDRYWETDIKINFHFL